MKVRTLLGVSKVFVLIEKAMYRTLLALSLRTKEAVSKVTDTASFWGYYSNVTLMEFFYAAIL